MFDFCIFNTSVEPQQLAVSAVPILLREGKHSIVKCTVGLVKPIDNLEISLTNKTHNYTSNAVKKTLNSDGLTHSVYREFEMVYPR